MLSTMEEEKQGSSWYWDTMTAITAAMSRIARVRAQFCSTWEGVPSLGNRGSRSRLHYLHVKQNI
jgi:hypothetical protein